MPKVLELKAADEEGCMWVKIEMPGPQGEVSLYTREEINRLKAQARQSLLDDITNLVYNAK